MSRNATSPETDEDVFRIKHDWDGPDSLQLTLLTAVAAVEGVEREDLPHLYGDLDTDALAAVFANRRDEGTPTDHVSFVYAKHHVRVLRDGRIFLRPLA